MLYPTQNQPLMFLVLICAGVVCALFFDLADFICKLGKNDKYAKNIFDFIGVFLSFGVLYLVNLLFNFGQFRFYVIAVFLAAFALVRIISKFLWTKLAKKCYSIRRRKEVGKGEKD